MKTTSLPTAEVLHRYFEYRDDGVLLWKIKVRGTRAGVGQPAGDDGSKTCPYSKVSVPGYGRFLAHRLIWVIQDGEIPEGLWVDHKNRNKNDNRIENLRLVDWAANQRNTGAKNKTGLPKHVFKTGNGRFAAILRIGTYDTPESASEAAQQASLLIHQIR